MHIYNTHIIYNYAYIHNIITLLCINMLLCKISQGQETKNEAVNSSITL